ncbi:hypothetical protein N8977_05365, partial [Alphaproteobacteria bacterium]|nr:hypothetical protein [Alphaproteobacteria bacterium]
MKQPLSLMSRKGDDIVILDVSELINPHVKGNRIYIADLFGHNIKTIELGGLKYFVGGNRLAKLFQNVLFWYRHYLAIEMCLKSLAPKLVILNNDCGLAERLIVRICCRNKFRTVLFVDGFIDSLGIQSRYVFFRLWAKTFGRVLGAVKYGMGDADHIIVNNEIAFNEIYKRNGNDSKKILKANLHTLTNCNAQIIQFNSGADYITYFTTDFLPNSELHAKQIEIICQIKDCLKFNFGRTVNLQVILHPNEHLNSYQDPRLLEVQFWQNSSISV